MIIKDRQIDLIMMSWINYETRFWHCWDFTDIGAKHEILVPEFNIQSSLSASSYVAIDRKFQVAENLDLEVWFLSRSSDGMLAYSARDDNGRGDFIWLALIGGRVQFRWDLGSGAGIVT